jgi:hypothetical protein
VNAVPAPWIRPIRPLATRTKGRKVPSHRAVAARYEPRWELEDGSQAQTALRACPVGAAECSVAALSGWALRSRLRTGSLRAVIAGAGFAVLSHGDAGRPGCQPQEGAEQSRAAWRPLTGAGPVAHAVAVDRAHRAGQRGRARRPGRSPPTWISRCSPGPRQRRDVERNVSSTHTQTGRRVGRGCVAPSMVLPCPRRNWPISAQSRGKSGDACAPPAAKSLSRCAMGGTGLREGGQLSQLSRCGWCIDCPIAFDDAFEGRAARPGAFRGIYNRPPLPAPCRASSKCVPRG